MEKQVEITIKGNNQEEVDNIENFIKLITRYKNTKKLSKASKKVTNNTMLLSIALSKLS